MGTFRFKVMTDEQYWEFEHNAVHDLIDMNKRFMEEFKIGSWERWDYDQDSGLFTFSHEGLVRVKAEFEFVGTFASSDNSFMWSWANDSFAPRYTPRCQKG